ncbi:MAG TPA: hypothetical protein PLA54_06070 [Spirochaetota bacterium]|nr:hypothetical protein [Spirochaetota bacterium]
MKKIMIIMVLFMISISTLSSTPFPSSLLTIKVVDSKTKEPLKNIVVYYFLESIRYKKHILFIIPVIDNGEIRREIVLKKCFTNDDGIVVIERGNFTVKKDERIEEHVFVNLDHTDNENNDNFKTYYSDISGYWYYSSKFYLCNKRYRAKYIGNSEIHGMETLKDYEDSIKDKIDLIWSKVDFKEIINNKELIVELNYQK